MNKYDIKYIFKRVLSFFIIFIILSFFNSCKVHAEEVVPRYAQVDGTYLYQDGRIKNAGKISKSYGQDATIRWTFNISPSYYVNMSTGEDASMYYATIKICTTQPYGNVGSYWQSGGQGYSEIIGVLETTNACTTNNYNGHYFYVYVKLVDFETPSAGADFSWSPFAFSFWYGQPSGQYAQVQDVYLSDSNYYSSDKAMYDSLINQQKLIDNQNATTQAQNDTNNILNNDNVDGASAEVDSLLNNSAFNDSSGIQSIINAPLNFINGLTNSCSPINVTIPYLNANLTIPCIKQELNDHIPLVVPVLSTAINGFIIYRILIDIVYIIKSSRNPDDDRIEVLDL